MIARLVDVWERTGAVLGFIYHVRLEIRIAGGHIMNSLPPSFAKLPRWLRPVIGGSAGLLIGSLHGQTIPAPDLPLVSVSTEVSGSFLPRLDGVSSIPVTTIHAAEIERTGVTTNVLDVLRKTAPAFTGSRNLGHENANAGTASTHGGSQLALRNLPTLVLINGRRAALSPVAASGGNAFVDVNHIPVSAIERIEVLGDGASAIYGSDAIGGVVNVVLKSHYQGFELGAHYGFSDNEGRWSERTVSLLGGASNGTTSLTLTAEWSKSDPLFQYERSFSDALHDTGTFAGVISVDAASKYYRADGKNVYLLNSALAQPPSGHQDLNSLVSLGVYSGPYTASEIQAFYNRADYGTLLQGNERKSAAVTVNHRLAPELSVFGELLYARTETFSQIDAQPIAVPLAATATANPTDSAITAYNRLVDYPRKFFNDTESVRGVVGFRGLLNEDVSWEIAAQQHEVRRDFRNTNLIDTTAREAAIANGSFVPTALIQLGDVGAAIVGTAHGEATSRLAMFDGVVRAKAFDLPAGAVQLALAGQIQRESLTLNSDRNSQSATFGWDSGERLDPLDRERTVKSLALQLFVPIFGGQTSAPYARALSLDYALRRDTYSDLNVPTVSKYTVRWQPFDPQLTVRGSFSRSFAAPTLYQLFGPTDIGETDTLTLAAYDANGVATGQTVTGRAPARTGSTTALQASEAENVTAGFVYAPKALRGFQLTADYFRVNHQKVVGTAGVATILASVEQLGAASPYASRVRIGQGGYAEGYFDGGTAISAPGEISAAGLSNVFVSDQLFNLGSVKLNGVDLGASYTRAVGLGRLDVATRATIYNHYRVRALADSPYVDYSNRVSDSLGALPDWHSYTTFNYRRGAFEFSLAHTYIPSLEDIHGLTPEERYVESYTQFDVQASYAFGPEVEWLRGTKLTLGVDNALNAFGSRSPSQVWSNIDLGTYGAVGRKFYVGLQHKF